MTNIEIIRKVNEGFVEGYTKEIMQYVADDVRLDVVGASTSIEKEALQKDRSSEYFDGLPTIKIKNEIEKGDWVAIEGEVECKKTDGSMLDAFFFDIYRLED